MINNRKWWLDAIDYLIAPPQTKLRNRLNRHSNKLYKIVKHPKCTTDSYDVRYNDIKP